MKYSAISILILGLSASLTLRAEPLFDSGEPNVTAGVSVSNLSSGADDFTLEHFSNLQSVVFWTYEEQNSTWNNTLEYAIWQDTGALSPSTTLARANASGMGQAITKEQVASNVEIGGVTYDQYEYSFSLDSSVGLSASTPYWLEIYLGTATNLTSTSGFGWVQTSTVVSGADGLPYINFGLDFSGPTDPPTWFSAETDNSLAFQLNGTIPTPSTLTLLAPLVLVIARRRRLR